jgi:hypothetical protein
MKNPSLSRWLFISAFAVLALYLIAEIIWTPIVSADVISGFLSLNNALLGKGANYQYFLADTGIIHKQFYTWHAPGQYFFPYLLGKPFNNIGYGIILTELISLVAGSIVYIKLFRKLKVADDIIALSLLLIFIQRFFHGVLLVYKTSDICLFFLVPALLLLLFTYHKEKPSVSRTLLCLAGIFLVNALGLFTKNSYVVFTAFAHLFFFSVAMYEIIRSRGITLKRLIYQSLPGVTLAVVAVGFYIGFYSRGVTPARAGAVQQDLALHVANIVFYPLITVFSAPFSFNGLMYRLPMLTITDLSNGAFSWKAIAVGVALVLPILVIFYQAWKDKGISPLWKSLTFSAIAFYCLTWGYFVFAASNVSNEDRLIFPAVLMATPALAYVLLRTRITRYIAAACVLISIVFSVAALNALKNYYDKGMVVKRSDIFNHFSVSDQNEHGSDLPALKQALGSRKNSSLLVMETTEDFFRTGLEMPAVTSYDGFHDRVGEIAGKNAKLFRAEGYKHVFFVIPAAKMVGAVPQNLEIEPTSMIHYKVLRFDL